MAMPIDLVQIQSNPNRTEEEQKQLDDYLAEEKALADSMGEMTDPVAMQALIIRALVAIADGGQPDSKDAAKLKQINDAMIGSPLVVTDIET